MIAFPGGRYQALPIAWDARALPEGSTALRMGFTTTDRGLGFGPLDVLVNDRIAARAEPGPGQASVEVPLAKLGLAGTVGVRDLWERAERGTTSGALRAEVESHGAVLLKATRVRRAD